MDTTVGTGLVVEALDARAVDAEDVTDLAALVAAERLADAPHEPEESARQLQLRLRHGWDGHPAEHLLVVRTSKGSTAGFAELHFEHWDNPDLALLFLHVHPSCRDDDGVAEAMTTSGLEAVRAGGRTSVLSHAWRDSWLAGYWERQGWPMAISSAQRRLVLADLDRERLAELLAEAELASPAYDVDDLPSPTPPDLVGGLLEVHRAMNDAPLDDLAVEDDQWTPQRLAASEAALAVRGLRVHRLLARRRCDGVLAGYTVVVVDPESPTYGAQEDTAVVGEHRGHRLGLRLKAAMLLRLATVEPLLATIDTWNAESNSHMIAVNDRLGCVVVGRGGLLQRPLA